MTFVAHPYERFADDLLTALTGGMIREEHEFVRSEKSYSLASPDVIAHTVKVFGQCNDSFLLFEGGIDYDYLADQGTIVWKEKGRLPDNHSFFYVNYYPREGRRRLTDRNPGSVTTTLAEAFARELAVLHKQMEMIYRSAFVDLAVGPSLDHVAALLALERKGARFASGEVLFKRNTPAQGDINIPAGTLVSTGQGQNFETSDKRTLRRGQLSTVVPIRAQVEGLAGRIKAGEISIINRPIFGIESVTNEKDTLFAMEKETDEELRRRIKGTLERAGKATLNAIKYSLIQEVPEINEGNLQISESAEVGKVEVRLGLVEGANPELVRRIEDSIFNARAAGVRVVHNLATRTSTSTGPDEGIGVTRAEAVEHLSRKGMPIPRVQVPQEILGQMPEGVLQLQIEVLLRLSESNISISQKENIKDGACTRINDFIQALPMGADLVYNKLLARIVESVEVADAALMIRAAPVAGIEVSEILDANLATDGRKVEAKSVFVGLMDEAIFIDIQVKLQPKPSVKDSAPITPQIETAINSAIKRELTGATGQLLKSSLKAAVKTSLTDTNLQLVADNPIVINAEFEETGRLLNNTELVPVEEHHVLELRKLDIIDEGSS